MSDDRCSTNEFRLKALGDIAKDHEERIRKLEAMAMKVIGASLFGSFLGAAVIWKLFG